MNSADEDEVTLSVQRDSVRREWSRVTAAPTVRRQRGTLASLPSHPPAIPKPSTLAVETVPPEPPPPPVDADTAFRRGRLGVVVVIVLVLFWMWLRQRRT